MKILAIDSSAMVATVAVVQDDVIIAEYTINHKKTHSQTLLPMIDEIKKMTELDMNTIDVIAITKGPGSYTGLRIGAATAKGIGLALDIPIVGIPTMDALAYNMFSTSYLVCPIMDARRKQVYTGIYDFDGDKFNVIMQQKVMLIDELIEELDKTNRKVIFLGDGVDILKDEIDQKMQTAHIYAPAMMNRTKASTVASLALDYIKNNKMINADEFSPDYLRLSQAERELKEKNKIKGKNIKITHAETGCGKLTIMEMAREDIDSVCELEKECFSTPWSKNSLETSAKKDNTVFLVGKIDEKIVGYCGLYIASDEADITNIAVTKNYRKNKIAESILSEIHNRAKENKVKKITLEVRESNKAAISLYEKMGYKIVGQRKDYYDNPSEDGHIMSIELE